VIVLRDGCPLQSEPVLHPLIDGWPSIDQRREADQRLLSQAMNWNSRPAPRTSDRRN